MLMAGLTALAHSSQNAFAQQASQAFMEILNGFTPQQMSDLQATKPVIQTQQQSLPMAHVSPAAATVATGNMPTVQPMTLPMAKPVAPSVSQSVPQQHPAAVVEPPVKGIIDPVHAARMRQPEQANRQIHDDLQAAHRQLLQINQANAPDMERQAAAQAAKAAEVEKQRVMEAQQ